METISLQEFTFKFIDISKNLTNAELRMLYLLITEVDNRKLTQQEFAMKVMTDRRTINIGLKKLKGNGYIHEDDIKDVHQVDIENTNPNKEIENATKKEVGRAKKLILKLFVYYYQFSKNKVIVVNEDFYTHVLGNLNLPKDLKIKKEFITETIKNSFPKAVFYFKKDKASYVSENHYNINSRINFEISKARKTKSYSIKIDKLLEHLFDNFQIREDEVLQVIREDFRKLRIEKNLIKIPRPPKITAL
jgi:hypothetical protein